MCRNDSLIKRKSLFWSPKLERALEGEQEKRFRDRVFCRKRVPKLQDLAIFGAVKCVCGLTFEG